MSQDCNRSEPQIFTQWTKIGFCWYTNHKSGPGSARNSQDPRSSADFVHQLFVPALFPFPVLISRIPRPDPQSLALDHITYLSLILVLLPGISGESQVTLMAHGEHLSVYYSNLSIASNLSSPGVSISNRDQGESQQRPSGWHMTIMSIAITISDHHPPWPVIAPPQYWQRSISMSPSRCLSPGPGVSAY